MEFPDLGEHCSLPQCKQLDFLPFKCNGCQKIFCKDHFLFEQHQCKNAIDFNKDDHQIPLCPICNLPVSFKRGELADYAMNKHIEENCLVKSNRNKIYKNKCSMINCSKKEMIELICEFCKKNFCLKHRHFNDHECEKKNLIKDLNQKSIINRQTTASNSAGSAAMKRLMNNSSNFVQKIGNLITPNESNNRPINSSSTINRSSNQNLRSLQGNLNDDEALAIAIQESINQPSTSSSNTHITNQQPNKIETITLVDDEDDDLKRAIELSKKEYDKNKDKCRIN